MALGKGRKNNQMSKTNNFIWDNLKEKESYSRHLSQKPYGLTVEQTSSQRKLNRTEPSLIFSNTWDLITARRQNVYFDFCFGFFLFFCSCYKPNTSENPSTELHIGWRMFGWGLWKNSHPLCGKFPHFFLQFVQDMKVWLVLFGILLELDHTLVRVLLQKIGCFKHHDTCQTYHLHFAGCSDVAGD